MYLYIAALLNCLHVLCTVALCAILSDVFALNSSLVSISVCLTNQQACMLPIIVFVHMCILWCAYIGVFILCLSVCLFVCVGLSVCVCTCSMLDIRLLLPSTNICWYQTM